jgi:hypothetical protein
MKLALLMDQYHDALKAKYGSRLLPSHLRAIQAITQCRTPQAGELFVHCPDCKHSAWRPRSCGHRDNTTKRPNPGPHSFTGGSFL